MTPQQLKRFIKKLSISDTGCWEWTGFRDQQGYGRIGQIEISDIAHRVSYTYFNGPIPQGHHIHHKCRNRKCVNPSHLRAIHATKHSIMHRQEQMQRSGNEKPLFALMQLAKTHCPQGHPYDEANTTYYTYKGSTWRGCITCKRKRQREYKKRIRDGAKSVAGSLGAAG